MSRRRRQEYNPLLDNGKTDASSIGPSQVVAIVLGISLVVFVALTITFGVLYGDRDGQVNNLRRNGVPKCQPTYKESECRRPEHRSFLCDDQKLIDNVLNKPVSQPLSVTRDAFGVPTIHGGTFRQSIFQVAYEHTKDHFAAKYFFFTFFSGTLSKVFGGTPFQSFAIQEDAFRHITFSDAEFNQLLASFSPIVRAVYEENLAGFNAVIQEIRDGVLPVPAEFEFLNYMPDLISMEEYLRNNYHVTQVFSGQSTDYNRHLRAFSRLESFVQAGTFTLEEAKKVVADMYQCRLDDATPEILLANFTQIPVLAERCVGGATARKSTFISRDFHSRSMPDPITTTQYLEQMEHLVAMLNMTSVVRPTASWVFAVSAEHTDTGFPMMHNGPQALLDVYGGVTYNAKIENAELDLDWTITCLAAVCNPGIQGVFGRNGYKYSIGAQVGSLPGIHAVYQDTSEDMFSHTATISVRGGSPVNVDVFTSPHGGFVTRRNVVSPLYSGSKSIVRREPDFGDWGRTANAVILSAFSESPCQLRNIYRGELGTDFNFLGIGIDNQCNTFSMDRGGHFQLPTSCSIPEGLLGEPITPVSELPLHSSYVVFNPTQGFIANWNTNFVRGARQPYGFVSRAEWMVYTFQNKTRSKQKLSYQDLKELMFLQSNARDEFSTFDGSNNFNSDLYPRFLRTVFEKAVATYPTADRLAAVEILKHYDGSYVSGDREAISSSLNISDEHMLSREWVIRTESKFEDAVLDGSTALTTDIMYQIFINDAAITSPKWKEKAPDINIIIVQALDDALTALGGLSARPWGTNLRPVATYSSTAFGLLNFIGFPNPVYQDSAYPSSNRAACYHTVQMLNNRNIQHDFVQQHDADTNLYFVNLTQSTAFKPVKARMHSAYLRYEPVVTHVHGP